MPAETAAQGPAPVAILIGRRRGGGQEQAACGMAEALERRRPGLAELAPLDETFARIGGWRAGLARWVGRRSIGALGLLAPLALGAVRSPTLVLFQGNAFLTVGLLRLCGRRVVAVCDAPPRRRGGLMALREALMSAGARDADARIRTFDFPLAAPATIAPNLLPDFPPEPLAFRPGTPGRLLFVGRLTAEKGVGAFLALAAQMPEHAFVVYGDGPLRAEVERTAARLGNLSYAGVSRDWRHQPDACLIGCCPLEACWTAGKEALLHGLPVLFIPSVTGGPQALATACDKALAVQALDGPSVAAALDRLRDRIALDPAPARALWDSHRPERIVEQLLSVLAPGN